MWWCLLNFVFIHAYDILGRAEQAGFRAAEDGVASGGFGAIGGVLPAAAGHQDYRLSEPGFGGRGADCGHDAVAVCEEGHFEGGAGVEVLAEEEVAVIESGGVNIDYEVVGARSWRWNGFQGETVWFEVRRNVGLMVHGVGYVYG
jgi:hypothetical protein